MGSTFSAWLGFIILINCPVWREQWCMSDACPFLFPIPPSPSFHFHPPSLCSSSFLTTFSCASAPEIKHLLFVKRLLIINSALTREYNEMAAHREDGKVKRLKETALCSADGCVLPTKLVVICLRPLCGLRQRRRPQRIDECERGQWKRRWKIARPDGTARRSPLATP